MINTKPLKLFPSAVIFISAAVLFTPLIITGVIMLCKEGWGFNRKTFVERLRFRRMTRRDWNYSLVALVAIGILTGGIMMVMQAIVPGFNHTPSFMTLEPLSSGRYWLLFLWLPSKIRIYITCRIFRISGSLSDTGRRILDGSANRSG